ncbi:MAG: PD-(D/E)XK nuclease family protein [Elusimicrobiota bacterium]
MSMRVFCGPFQPSLEDAFVERVRRLAASRATFAVVAPSRRMAERLQRLLALERGLGLLGARFHTFHSLALEVVEEAGGFEEGVVADGLFHDKVIDAVLAARPRSKVSTRGLASAYRAGIRDLVDCGFEPRAYREDFEGLLADGAQKRRLQDVLEVQESYLRRLSEIGVVPPSGLTHAAAETVESGVCPALERYGELLYYGFYDLTGAQADFFSAVVKAHPVSVFFPYVKGHPAYRFAERFYDVKLHAGGASPVHLPPAHHTRALGPVLDALSRPGARAVLPSDAALAFISASGAEDESWAAAKEILRLRSGANPPDFSEIGIVARTLGPYRSRLPAVLRENAVPFSMEAGDPLLRHPIAKLCLGLLQFGRRDFPAADLLDIVESRYFRSERFEGGGSWRRLRSNWRRLIERVGVQGGWTQWEGMVARWAEEDLELFPRRVSEGLPGQAIAKEETALLWEFLKKLEAELRRGPETSWSLAAARARRLLEDNFSVEQGVPGFEAWSALLDAVDALAAFDRLSRKTSWEGFLDVLDEKFRSVELEPPAPCRGVRILDAMDARGESFRVLFILGLQEGVFPRQVREDPLIPDAVRAKLRDSAGYWIQPKLGGYDEERLLFQLLATSACEKVYCVHQRSDEDGKALVESLYLRELRQAAGQDVQDHMDRRVPRQPLVKLEELAREDPGLLAAKEVCLLQADRGEGEGGLFAPLSGHVPAFAFPRLFRDGLRSAARLNSPGELGPWDGLIREPREFLAKIDRQGLSPSALEEFRNCPFKTFASRLLGLKEVETPSRAGELDPREKGRLYHAVLERFYRALDAGGFWEDPEAVRWQTTLEACFTELLPWDGWRALGVYPVLWKAAQAAMRRHLLRVVEADIAALRLRGLRPRSFESELTAAVDGLRLQGKLDRIDWDVAGSAYRVVDYKTTFHQGRLENLVARLKQIQPPLYLELVESSDTAVPKGAQPLGADFFAIEDSKETTGHEAVQSFEAVSWRKLRPLLLDGLRGLREMMARGEFFITPQEGRGEACEYCPFGSLCRKSHGMTLRRAESSRLRVRFDLLREPEAAR